MITEVYINDQLIDIEDEQVVAATYGNISFGEMNKRKGIKSPTWNAPFSPKNKLVLESCEVAGSNSVVPYRKGTIRVDIHGVTVFTGFCVVNEAYENYEILSFAGASDFYTLINGKKLVDLDLSAHNHYWSEVNIRTSWNGLQGYIYAVLLNGKVPNISDAVIAPDSLLPHIFFKTVINQIAVDAGYTIVGDVLTNPDFTNRLILVNKYPLPVMYGEMVDLALLLPDIAQQKIWMDFANFYGLQFDIDDQNKIIRANYIDDLLFNDPEDWTGKVDKSERFRTKYSLQYGQTSLLKYTVDDVCTQDFQKAVTIDDNTLDLEVDIYKSPLFAVQFWTPGGFTNGLYISNTFIIRQEVAWRGVWDASTLYGSVDVSDKQIVWWNGTYYQAIADSTGQEPPDAAYWKVVPEKDVFEVKSRPMYGMLEIDPASLVQVVFPDENVFVTRIVTGKGLDWPYLYEKYYKVFSRIIVKSKAVTGLIKLNNADINQLDFTRLKRIDNELYILEQVTQFKMNVKESTLVDFIRL